MLANRQMPEGEALDALVELVLSRAGVAYASISYPDGTFRGAYIDETGLLAAQESRTTDGRRDVFHYERGRLLDPQTEPADYDPRTRPFYKDALAANRRIWTAPYPFYKTHETGITCAEPLFRDGELVAVLTVDFHVGALSTLVARPGLDQARSVVFAGDGTILAYPSGDPHDPVIEAVIAAERSADQEFVQLDTPGGSYLASIAPIGGTRAGASTPLDWYVGTVIPTSTLLGPSDEVVRGSLWISAGAIAVAVALSLVVAWNILRMRRQVAASRLAARDATAKAKALGSYRLVAKLGAGGMGEVWRAEHQLLARQAAIKLIRPEALRDREGADEIRERFRREAQVLASMRSRHTISLYDYGVADDGAFYYVMELLDGLDLEALVVKHGPQPFARVVQIMLGACASLAEAHDAGLLHRDIKPPNLMLSRAADELDIVKLLDFGIVQAAEDEGIPATPLPTTRASEPKLTQIGSWIGTPGFMAPEQILARKLDGRADLYALGCVAWWLLTGKEVYSRRDGEQLLLERHMQVELPVLAEEVRGYVPAELVHVLEACLAKRPDERPADARALAAMLRAVPISDELAWSEARAAAWWAEHRPPNPVSPSLSTRQTGVRVVVRGE